MKRQFLLNTLFFLTLFLLLGLSSLFAQANPPLFIRLKNVTFDPLSTTSPPAPSLEQAADSEQQLTYLVQFTGPVREEWKVTLTQLGVTLHGYIPDYTFLARMKSATVSQIQTLPFVRWVGIYQPTYRLAPELTSPNLQATTAITVWVQTFPNLDLAKIRAQIVAWGGKVEGRSTDAPAGYLRVVLPSSHLADLAALEGVLWVEPFFPPAIKNEIAGGELMRGQEVQQSLGLSGAGQIIGIADTGLDTGDLATLHPDLRGRVIKTYCLGRTNPCDWSDPHGHGTHVAGSVLGNGSVSKAYNAAGPSYAGLAPQASLVFQSTSDSTGGLLGIPEDLEDLLRTAYQDGVRIHSNSWGSKSQMADGNLSYGGYDTKCKQIDNALWENKDLLALFAAGNEGEDKDKNGLVDPDSINSPGTAKNVLTVGASETNRPTFSSTWENMFKGKYGEPIASDKEADNPRGLAAFSSRGPTDDGRIKPDIVSPGTYIASLHSRKYTFNDTFEGAAGDTSGTYNQLPLLGGTQSWQLLTNEAHSGSYSWQQSVKGMFNATAMTVLLTPPMNIKPIGSKSTTVISFWQKYTLTGDNRLAIVFTDQTGEIKYRYNPPLSISQGTYTRYVYQIEASVLTYYGLDLENLRIGFALRSESGNYDSTWWLDDLRVEGGNWGKLSNFGLAQPGDILDEAYAFMGGTSMATPLTAGGAALLREWLTTKAKISNPSAALLKGFLIQGAEDISPGQYLGNQEVPTTRPNNVSGWGRINLAQSMNPSQPQKTWFVDNNTGMATGQTKEYNFVVGNTTGTGGALRATLVWTDYAAEAYVAKALVNDLDLELIAPDGKSYPGNGGIYSTEQCLRDGKWDTCNNVEGIILPQASNGNYKLIVHAVNVPMGNLQPFAFVFSGDYLATSSTPTPTATSTLIPTPTSTLIPTATSTPTPTATSTLIPTPTSTPTPEPLLVENSSPTLLGSVTFFSTTVNSALPYSYIQWDFGDHSAIQSGSNLLQINHLYTATRRFYPKVSLFTSNGSLIKAATTQVDVIPLTLMGNGPTLLGKPTTFTVTLGKGFTAYQQLQWDFGDGKAPLLTHELNATYTYTFPKTYLVTATLIIPFDQRGIYVYDDLAAKTIKIEVKPPKLSLISTNLPSATVLLTATVNDFALPTADLTFDLGDQTTQEVILPQGMKSASIQHTYAKEGNYIVLATLSSPSYGEKLAENELQVSVTNPFSVTNPLPKVFLPLVLQGATPSSNPSPTVIPTSVSIAPEAQALAQANIYRQLVNAPLLSLQANITQAAKDHATYYTTNYKSTAAFPGGNVHGEVEGFTGFTGVNFWDRMKNAGYTGSARFEVMHLIADPLLTVESWVASVYHRIPFIDPRMNEVGYGQAEVSAAAAAVMDFGASTNIAPVETSTVILYPVPNQTAVPRAWDCNEAPNPYADVSCSSSNPVGYVITILPMGNQTFDQLELSTAAGTLVTTHSIRYDSAFKVWYAAATAPLNASTSYNVKLQGKDNAGKALTLNWSFTTGTKFFQTNSKATLLALPGR